MTNSIADYDIREKQMFLPFSNTTSFKLAAGSFRKAEAVREAFTATLKDCHLSPEQIADEMTRLTGEKVSKSHIANWSAESKSNYRLPLQLAAAFCVVTNDNRVLKAAFEGSGIHLLDDSQMVYFEIGRASEAQRESAAKVKAGRNRLKELKMMGDLK